MQGLFERGDQEDAGEHVGSASPAGHDRRECVERTGASAVVDHATAFCPCHHGGMGLQRGRIGLERAPLIHPRVVEVGEGAVEVVGEARDERPHTLVAHSMPV